VQQTPAHSLTLARLTFYVNCLSPPSHVSRTVTRVQHRQKCKRLPSQTRAAQNSLLVQKKQCNTHCNTPCSACWFHAESVDFVLAKKVLKRDSSF
jgi:hypothetical protein